MTQPEVFNDFEKTNELNEKLESLNTELEYNLLEWEEIEIKKSELE